jgi:hypothetical protein
MFLLVVVDGATESARTNSGTDRQILQIRNMLERNLVEWSLVEINYLECQIIEKSEPARMESGKKNLVKYQIQNWKPL